jgi:hypothetical protein
MTLHPGRRRALPGTLALLLCGLPAAAQVQTHLAPRIGGTGVYALPSLSPGFSAPNLSLGAPALSPLSISALTQVPVPTLSPAVVPLAPAGMPVAAAPVSVQETLQQGVERYGKAQERDASGASGAAALRGLYEGEGRSQGLQALDSGVLVNDEGVGVFGKAAAYYKEIRRTVEALKGRADLAESLDVMDDAYGDVWAKLKAVEAIAQSRQVDQHNTHLEESLTWVDGVMRDHGRTVAIHTQRVYFHHSPNPRSEIAEGIRRTDKYLHDVLKQFVRSGRAEKAMGRFDEVVLAFDTRGYAEIKAHLQAREAEISKAFNGRYRFVYLDELVAPPASREAMRAELNALTEKYRGKGLDKIIEGVIYSRYVGLLLELKTVEHLLDSGYQILQSGRELFDEKGMYVTELDGVARAPDGRVIVVEAKSARVQLPPEEVLRDKVIAKLDCYLGNRALLDKFIGSPFDEVLFSFDVGGQPELAEFLKGREAELSRRYGVPVRFLFLETGPARGQQGKHRKK